MPIVYGPDLMLNISLEHLTDFSHQIYDVLWTRPQSPQEMAYFKPEVDSIQWGVRSLSPFCLWSPPYPVLNGEFHVSAPFPEAPPPTLSAQGSTIVDE